MNKTDIVKEVRAVATLHRLKLSDIMIGYGAGLVLHGLNNSTSDVDCDIPAREFNRLKRGRLQEFGLFGYAIALSDKLDAHVNTSKDSSKVQSIEGLTVHTLPMILECYIRMAEHPDRNPNKRSTDAERIERIRKALKRPASARLR